MLTASADSTARLWEVDNGKLLTTFQGHTGDVFRAVFSPDGRRVLTASWDNTARLWKADSGKLLVTFQEGHYSWVSSAGFSPDGRRVLTASEDNTARLWEADSGKLLAVFLHPEYIHEFKPTGDRPPEQIPTASVNSAVFSPDGRRVLTASDNETARLWEAPP